uniref:Uncharacterized protein n=1 Tax=uncultured bacterium B19D1_C12D4_E9D6 TaxID=1329637 RepID=S4W424_9BACT|nr:hypothetical protein [uncultured bacterium B19D1_C12D4_E9D6]
MIDDVARLSTQFLERSLAVLCQVLGGAIYFDPYAGNGYTPPAFYRGRFEALTFRMVDT